MWVKWLFGLFVVIVGVVVYYMVMNVLCGDIVVYSDLSKEVYLDCIKLGDILVVFVDGVFVEVICLLEIELDFWFWVLVNFVYYNFFGNIMFLFG